MKFDLTMTHSDFARHGSLHVIEGMHSAWAAIKRLVVKLLIALKPINLDEDFLNKSSNHADLERRMQILMSPERWQGRWWD